VTYTNGTLIIPDGGIDELIKWLNQHKGTDVYTPVTVHNVTYYVYPNGTVTYTNHTVVPGANGTTWGPSTVPKIINIYGTNYTCKGEVCWYTDSGEVIISEGGEDALKHLLVYRSVKINNDQYRLYGNGSSAFMNGTQILPDGGENALIEWWTEMNRKKYQRYRFDDIIYHVYPDGVVTYANGTVVLQSGGLEQLKTLLGYNEYPYTEYSVGNTLYHLYNNNTLTYGNGTVIVTEKGNEKLQEIIEAYQKAPRTTRIILNGVTYIVYSNGTITHANGTVVIDGDLKDKIKTYIVDNPPAEIVVIDNKHIIVHDNGTITFKNGTVISDPTLIEQILDLINNHPKPEYRVVKVNGEPYHVYNNGTVTYPNGTLILPTGGEQALIDWIKEHAKLPYQVVQIDGGDKYHVYDNGTITYPNGTRVTDQRIIDIIQGLPVTRNILHVGDDTYYIYSNGTITYKNGTEITDEEKKAQILKWLAMSLNPPAHSIIVNGVEYIIYNNGTVTFENGTVVVPDGGEVALKEWLKNHPKPEHQVVEINGTEYHVYPNGTVTYPDTPTPIVIDTLPVTIVDILKNHTGPEYQTLILEDGTEYHVYPNGTVIRIPEGDKVTNMHILDLIDEWVNVHGHPEPRIIQVNGERYTLYDNETLTYPNGTVIIYKDAPAVQEWIKQQTQPPQYTRIKDPIDNVEYHVYENGTVTFQNGTMLFEDGGKPRLIDYLNEKHRPKYQVHDVDGTKYRIYDNGTVTNYEGDKVIVPEGGLQALMDWLTAQVPLHIVTDVTTGMKYRVFRNGSSVDENGVVVVPNGGKPALIEFLNNKRPMIYHYLNDTYHVYNNQSVYHVNGTFITDGGIDALRKILSGEQEPYSVHIANGVEYHIFDNGTVSFHNGTVLFEEGGLPKLLEWLQNMTPQKYKYDGQEYWVYEDGRVTFPNGTAICMEGGFQCLVDYIKRLIEPDYEIVYVDGKEVHCYYDTGKCVWKNGTTIIEEGGPEELHHHFQYPKKYIIDEDPYWVYKNGSAYDKDGEFVCVVGPDCIIDKYREDHPYTPYIYNGTEYHVYPNGTVTHENGTVISPDGGVEALKIYLQGLNHPDHYIVIDANSGTNYSIYDNGTVFQLPSHKVICETGGRKCLQDYLRNTTPTVVEYDDEKYLIYPNGTVINNDTGKVITIDGGKPKLIEYINSLPCRKVLVHDSVFTVCKNGTCTEDDSGVIWTTEGLDDLIRIWREKLRDEFKTYRIANGTTYEVYPDNHIIGNNGFECSNCTLQDLLDLIDGWPRTYEINNVTYKVYQNGTVTKVAPNETLYLPEGGYDELILNLTAERPIKWINVTINGQQYAGFPDNNTVLRLPDGERVRYPNVDQLIDQETRKIQSNVTWIGMYEGKNYTIYPNQTVYDEDGNKICPRGGEACLISYLELDVANSTIDEDGNRIHTTEDGKILKVIIPDAPEVIVTRNNVYEPLVINRKYPEHEEIDPTVYVEDPLIITIDIPDPEVIDVNRPPIEEIDNPTVIDVGPDVNITIIEPPIIDVTPGDNGTNGTNGTDQLPWFGDVSFGPIDFGEKETNIFGNLKIDWPDL